ncbi:hypothetical protein [Arthrobacter sp. AL12]|uniref:hypothetical protein n=1 Tax=Arthrobacter sp. AL12 TaxID=3042241 RepID=UPI00249BBB6F|nr:hypothetical protein [Arthrobacter sp. AL12]MDI3213133.1 hypothetical protein [Arthrobacter sp. AL12]
MGLSLILAAAMALAGCAYEYEDAFASGTESASAPGSTDAALPGDPATRQPVSGAELDAWLSLVLPATEGEVLHTGYGTLEADEEREETTAQLPSGTYSLTLACRSPRRVSFSIEHGDQELVDLNLRCETPRVNVVYLSADAVLTIKVEAVAGANFAYRVTRI